jgi:aspartate aminotransferase
MEKRRNLAYELAAKLFDCIKPQGAFYLFPNVEKNLNDEIKTTDELISLFLEKANVAVVPGREFGMENNIRISYAISQEKIKKGFEQMEKVL